MMSTIMLLLGMMMILSPFIGHETDRLRGLMDARRNLRHAIQATADDGMFAPLVEAIDKAEMRR